ncbi:MAG: hypothetical protein M3063_07680 [Actinomycetota bacterium]|nr:hypothetical protein [Actinomycetota bacterium]
MVDLETDVGMVGGEKLGAKMRSEHDDEVVKPVVDREHLWVVVDDDGEATELFAG